MLFSYVLSFLFLRTIYDFIHYRHWYTFLLFVYKIVQVIFALTYLVFLLVIVSNKHTARSLSFVEQ